MRLNLLVAFGRVHLYVFVSVSVCVREFSLSLEYFQLKLYIDHYSTKRNTLHALNMQLETIPRQYGRKWDFWTKRQNNECPLRHMLEEQYMLNQLISASTRHTIHNNCICSRSAGVVVDVQVSVL